MQRVYADNSALIEAHNRTLVRRGYGHYSLYKRRFSFLGYYLQHREWEVLRAAVDFMQQRGWVVGALKHDGFLIEKRADMSGQPSGELLNELGAHASRVCTLEGVRFAKESLTEELLDIPRELLPP